MMNSESEFKLGPMRVSSGYVVFLNVPKSLAMAPAVTIGIFQYRT